jgi:integrative and conjugative element protein (TIGR02256 family)
MPTPEFFELGEVSSLDTQQYPLRVQELIRAILRYPFAKLQIVRRVDHLWHVEVEFDVERPQHTPIPILESERVGILLSKDPIQPPVVLALRKDFPQTLHQNLTPPNDPRILCLFEENYYEVMERLTPSGLLARISDWLKRAAIEELHSEGQPLEPLLLTSDRIIVNEAIFETGIHDNAIWVVESLSDEPRILHGFTLPLTVDLGKLRNVVTYTLLPIEIPPTYLRVIEYQPKSLEDLVRLLTKLGVEIIDTLRSFVMHKKDLPHWGLLKQTKIILLLKLPKIRVLNGEVENVEHWAFLVDSPLEELGQHMRIWDKVDGEIAHFIPPYPEPQSLNQIRLWPLKPTYQLSRALAQRLSGVASARLKIVCVGAGALGSQVIINLARQGIGHWTVIDQDHLLPHNFARHALSRDYVGWNKADALTEEVRLLLNDMKAARSAPINVLRYDASVHNDLNLAFSECELLLDLSASHAVAGFVTHIEGPKNRISAFMSDQGRYFVLLSEGTKRLARLDDLEAQLAAVIASDPQLSDFNRVQSEQVIYAGSCRDLSTQLPQDLVAIYSGIASQYIKLDGMDEEPKIHVWRWDELTLSIQHIDIPVQPTHTNEVNGWEIHILEGVVTKMGKLRTENLPNETGGVLLGNFNVHRKIVHIADLLPSPPDSIQWPNMYIRGSRHLGEEIARKQALSGNDLRYVGEWHTHPFGNNGTPSTRDHEAHQYLIKHMAAEGLPGIVVILGDSTQPFILLDSAP